MYKQIIIVRKDLNMSAGKLAAQVSHASEAFLTVAIKRQAQLRIKESKHPAWISQKNKDGNLIKRPHPYRRLDLSNWAKDAFARSEDSFYTRPVNPDNPYGQLMLCEPTYYYQADLAIDKDVYEQWMCGAYRKCVLGAKNKTKLLRAVEMAKELGMVEGEDFFVIWDNCYTELEPEEYDASGQGKIITCIGFKPMESELIDNIGRKYHLY